MNEDEVFYKNYYFARQQQYSLEKFLAELDMRMVLRRNLLVLERKETIPLIYEDSFFFDLTDNKSIVVQRHNRYSPVLTHAHTFFELIYIYDGRCTNTISGQKITMHTGDICIIPPEIEHSIAVFDESIVINIMIRRDTLNTIFYNFLTTQNILSSFFLNNIYARQANDYIIFHTGSDLPLKEAFLRMLWENQNKDRYYYEAISTTLALCFYLLIRNYEDSVQMPEFAHKQDVQRYALIRYIQENYQNITLQAIAKKFHYTPEYTSKLIKETTNMTYTEILLRIRMEKAQDLLANTNMTILQIAEEIGYDTAEHFIRQFKKFTTMTPTAYRKISAVQ
ncbi:MAG: helix-turn-helix domain-containing protein [Lachnospiraceae bacterium]|nr:helix-turn-helix domain-containing protein [Lachnospiraceae bacterium]